MLPHGYRRRNTLWLCLVLCEHVNFAPYVVVTYGVLKLVKYKFRPISHPAFPQLKKGLLSATPTTQALQLVQSSKHAP